MLGVDDGPFEFSDETAPLVGTVFRGPDYIEGVLKREIAVDGFDVTDAVVDMVVEGRHRDQVQAVLLDGITFGGFNVADLDRIAERTGCAVVAVSTTEPDADRLARGLDNVDRRAEREELIERAGEPNVHEVADGEVYFQFAGTDAATARELIDLTTRRGRTPEPVRVAHMVAAALKEEESKGGP